MTVVTEISAPTRILRTRREILLDAAALIEEHGWIQGGEGMPGQREHYLYGKFCILGAIASTLGYNSDDTVVYDRAGEVVFGDPRIPAKYAFQWNDEPLRTQEEVLRALRRLADGEDWYSATEPVDTSS